MSAVAEGYTGGAVDDIEIERTLVRCEQALQDGGRPALDRLGFWKAVGAVKRDRGLIYRYCERIARIDREAFVRGVPIALPAAVGVVLDTAGALVGLALVAAAPGLPDALGTALPWTELAYLAGALALIGTTHGLAHWVAGTLMGIRFTHWYSRPPLSPQPGFKTDYASYLRAPARSRAWMHAAGAIVTKILPFAVAALAAARGAEAWAVGSLLALGVLQLFTDVLISTKASDWKKFAREMRFAR